MKTGRILAVLLLAATGGSVFAQAKITHTPAPCVRGNRSHVLMMGVTEPGELRLFYRKPSMNWCTMTGLNRGLRSSVPLPTIANGDELEYFAVLVQGRRVIGRTEQIYHVRAHERCEFEPARLQEIPASDCTSMTHLFGQSHAAAFAIPETAPPEPISPESPL